MLATDPGHHRRDRAAPDRDGPRAAVGLAGQERRDGRRRRPDTIVMHYAPRDEEEFALTAAVLNTSYAMARS
jgi:hypothetical protein